MRTVYAVQFQVFPKPDIDAAWQTALNLAVAWPVRWYDRRGTTLALKHAPQVLVPIDGHRIEITHADAGSGERLWTQAWSYPADDDPGMLWQSFVTVAAARGSIEVSLVLRIGSTRFRVAPPTFRLRRPNLVKTLLDGVECSLGEQRILPRAYPVTAGEVEALVAHLRSADRRLPYLLVSRDPYSERPLLNADEVADQVAGLAHVRVFADKWASFKLTSLLGKANSCFNGAVRLYWPGASQDEIRADRTFMPDEVRAEPGVVGDRLFRRLAASSAFRFVEMDVTRVAREAVERERLAQQRRAQEKALADASDRTELETLLNGLLGEKEKIASDLKQARDDNEVLRLMIAEEQEKTAEREAEVKELQKTIGVVRPEAPVVATGEQVPDEEVDPKSVREALDEAADRFTDDIEVWGTAEESANASDFGRPSDVFQALWAIRDFARQYFAARDAKKPLGRWADNFEQKGLKFAPQETQTTMTQYGQERDFTNGGVKRRIEKHLTLGGGDKKNCLQIYFDVDEAKRRFVIAHCGRHLRTDKYH